MAGIQGIDVSYDQGNINWSEVAGAGKRFAIIRASHGVTVDSKVHAYWNPAQQAGLLRGAYHFFQYGDDPEKQAETFLSVFTDGLSYGSGELPPALDLEANSYSKAPDAGYVAAVQVWLQQVARSLGKTPLIYIDPSFWETIGAPAALLQYPLWIAEYASQPRVPSGWQSYSLWQYSGDGTVSGIATRVDLDVFNGSESDLQALTR